MKLVKKVLAGVAVAAAMATSAHATNTIAGVTWDPTYGFDFGVTSASLHQSIDSVTGIVSGFGTVSTVNGASTFCSGCELTFTFGGFTPISVLLPSPSGGTFKYKDGWVNFYVDSTPETFANSNLLSMTNATTSDGALWLAVSGHNLTVGASAGTSFFGTVSVNPVTGSPDLLTGSGYLDVVAGVAGGLARDAMDTNTKTDGADFVFTSGFSNLFGTPNPLLESTGTATFTGDSIQVPEPTSLALVGLGLLGLAASRRRKSV